MVESFRVAVSIPPHSRRTRTWTEPSAASSTTLLAPATTPPAPSSSSTPPRPLPPPPPPQAPAPPPAALRLAAAGGTLDTLRTTDAGRSWQVDLRAPANLAANTEVKDLQI